MLVPSRDLVKMAMPSSRTSHIKRKCTSMRLAREQNMTFLGTCITLASTSKYDNHRVSLRSSSLLTNA